MPIFLAFSLFPQFVSARNGSFCNTFMAKSDFWSSSLPRSLPRRKVRKYNRKDKILTITYYMRSICQYVNIQVTFDDETPERPPPPPPARLQSINTMKDFSGVSQAYNQVTNIK